MAVSYTRRRKEGDVPSAEVGIRVGSLMADDGEALDIAWSLKAGVNAWRSFE